MRHSRYQGYCILHLIEGEARYQRRKRIIIKATCVFAVVTISVTLVSNTAFSASLQKAWDVLGLWLAG
jgi:hypothetical protein